MRKIFSSILIFIFQFAFTFQSHAMDVDSCFNLARDLYAESQTKKLSKENFLKFENYLVQMEENCDAKNFSKALEFAALAQSILE